MQSNLSLYIHIPFCTQLCPYCGFAKTKALKLRGPFIQALIEEIRAYSDAFPSISCKTIFFGGGTPSCLTYNEFKQIFDAVRLYFDMTEVEEITVEMNPENINAVYLNNLAALGVNRLSLGLQSLKQSELDFLGRTHKVHDILDALDHIQSSQIPNFNIDIIYSLPNIHPDNLVYTLNKALEYKPSHISTYALTIEPGTPFQQQGIRPSSNDNEADVYLFIQNTLKQYGYDHYEVSAFALPDAQCLHNLCYWHYRPYLGLGPGACSFFNNQAYRNQPNTTSYIKNPTAGIKKALQKKGYSKMDEFKDFMTANLRRLNGISIEDIDQRFSINFRKKYADKLGALYKNQWITSDKHRLKITEKGLFMLDSIAQTFF